MEADEILIFQYKDYNAIGDFQLFRSIASIFTKDDESFRVGTLQGRTNDSIKPINPSNSICKMIFFTRCRVCGSYCCAKKEFNLRRTLGWSSYN
ncbi:hypothetical protein CICLE_v10029682mg [Citrus x clementina]|uniref:Uncharacterized protein n=1 Tax=Citrus clementina TaxID=85681 RepID=V4RQ47_CITCL|nr:hypothetical protein CICLE_v10029682mg [Citrus x clementina]